MQHSFIHKLLIAVVAGFLVAGLIQFYKNFIAGADEAINQGYNQRYGISGAGR
jgi:hypothetical protein